MAIPFLVLSGTMESIHMTTNQTVLQLLAPDHLRGRLTSVLQLAQIINPVGILAAGLLWYHFGAELGFVFSWRHFL